MCSSDLTHDGNVEVSFSAELSASDKTALQDIIDNHDGLPARTSEALQRKREIIFSRIVDMAHRHPVLKVDDTVNTPPHTGAFAISDYLRSIDNYVNQWKRDGNHEPLVAKIIADAQAGDHTGFLNVQVSNDPVASTYQFLISEIPTTPYV